MSVLIPSKVSKVVDIVVSVAAALVVWGALQKILHTPSADLWLKIGLTTEAIVFLIYAILYLAYPVDKDTDSSEEVVKLQKVSKQQVVAMPASSAALDKMMSEADLTPTTFSKLSEGFKKFNASVESMGDVTNAIANTAAYSTKVKEVSVAFDGVKEALNKSVSSMSELGNVGQSFSSFKEQIQTMNKNLGSLNTIYEMELQENSNHLKSLNKFYGNLNQMASSLSSSTDDAVKTKEQLSMLVGNLSKLNQVYGSMITAMQTGGVR